MKTYVLKFGGTSVGNAERIKKAADRIAKYHKTGMRLAVIVSALGETTDELIELARKITANPSKREMDMLMSTGEQISTALLAMALHELKVDAISLTGFQVGIKTDSSHTKARIISIEKDRIIEEFRKGRVVIIAGFQGVNINGEITTLGRGGSDLSAVAVAKALRADCCEIYTDVDGIYTADPRIVSSARKIARISYEEMLELASLGAQVMQARSIEVAGKFDVPIHVRSSLNYTQGTWIVKGDRKMENTLVRGVTANTSEAKITLLGVTDKPGMAGRIFRAIADANVNVDMIVQNIGRTSKETDISFTVPSGDLDDALKAINGMRPKLALKKISFDRAIAKVSVVGIGMRSHSGVAADMFELLGKNKINIDMITTSEIKISCIVKKSDASKAVKLLHDYFVKSKQKYDVV